jgi:transposase-like protein
MAKRKRRSFSADFKAEAVRLCKLGDRTINQIAKELDLTET